jgi:hypothetical protein
VEQSVRIPLLHIADATAPKQRKGPLENASHVRNAAARFDQVEGVTEAERRALTLPYSVLP